jgi:hypothetical protein
MNSDWEYTVEVPEQYVTGDPKVRIMISAVGGGTVGRAYRNNNWEYAIEVDGAIIQEGTDLRSSAIGATHSEMALTLASFAMAEAEADYYGRYDTPLSRIYERLQAFAYEAEG